jgi:electron transfer flavoprotein alpha subunit
MSVLVFTEVSKGKNKKSSLETLNYAAKIAGILQTTVTAISFNNNDAALQAELGKAGANKILTVNDNRLESNDIVYLTAAVEQLAKAENAKVIIFAHDTIGKSVAPRLSAKLRAGLVAGAVDYPVINGNSFEVKKNVFSGKAIATYAMHSDTKIISLLPNSFQPVLGDGTASVEQANVDLSTIQSRIVVKEVKKSTSTLSLTEAELVVSAGRGLKGPEHWGIVEELATELGAATACSRPVADMHWRPHHEHVGQTGFTVRPNLYIAIGISGAIQHLAGVNGSKTIVVINNDKEAPFFKSADYGIVGDAFEILPKLTAAIKKFKANQN